MKLSIIVPFHRGRHFLEDCLISISEQNITDFETILVLDHIREDISDLISTYKDINIITVDLNEPVPKTSSEDEQKNEILERCSGAASARNAGMDAATGEYVYFLDSDDYILSNTLPLLLAQADELKTDMTYGKKKNTWFRRVVYLVSIEESAVEEVQEETSDDQDSSGEEDVDEKELRRKNRILNVKQMMEEEGGVHRDIPDTRAEAYYYLYVSRKGLGNVSVLGVLFRRSFLTENKIQFNEDFRFYSDSIFITQALEYVESFSRVEDAVYVKRKHNDPIHYPSLSQIKAEKRFEEHIAAYRKAREYTTEKDVRRWYLDNKLIAYFTSTYAPRLRRSENEFWRTTRFDVMQSCIKEIDPNIIKSLKGYRKKVVKALIRGDLKKTTRIVNMHLGRRKLKRIKKNKRILSYYLYNKFFTKLAMKENYVICESFFGKSYSDSPKYIYEYLCRNYPGRYKFIWVINNKKTNIPFKPIKIKRYSIRYYYYMALCKYNVFNVRQPGWVRKRDGNVFLETWHGTPLKKLVFDQEEVMAASPLYKSQFYKHSRVWDYLVSANHFSTKTFKRAFLFDKEILEYGYPRNDILHSKNREETAHNIREKLHIPKDKKTILYAPTWRDDEYYDHGKYKFELKLDLKQLKEEFGRDYIVLLRTHYYIADSIDVTGVEDFAYNVSKYDDISELYLVSDLLITDYSSVFFDYANLKRPILFYTYDLDKYRDIIRGFYMNIETDVPGPLLFTNGDVIDAIHNIDAITEEYKEKYEEFYERFCGIEDGHASENVAKRVFNLS